MSMDFKKYIAHTSKDGRVQSVKDHLVQTAELSRDNAIPEFKEIAYCCGLYHDLGKYSPEFQNYIQNNGSKTVHAQFGAMRVIEKCLSNKASYAAMLGYCIGGHHAGLPDGGVRNDNPEQPTLWGIIKREKYDCSEFDKEIGDQFPDDTLLDLLHKIPDAKERIEAYSFLTRYIYSCLTDADFIDTERFCSPDAERGIKEAKFEAALEKVNAYLEKFDCVTDLQKARSGIQSQVYDCTRDNNANIYIIDMPTGSGKTLCSIKSALETAIKHKKKRIIYVIPYTSIIEQTAKEFRDIFGNVLPVLEHHSNYDYDNIDDEKDNKNKDDDKKKKPTEEDEESKTTSEKLRKTCENYDAPLIITTNVQFFESLYHNKSSRLRKLHNFADSVLVFDEVHTLPIKYIQPCLRAIGYITKYLHSTAILMSATMPDYTRFIEKYVPQDTKIEYAVKDKSLFDCFDKCKYEYIGQSDIECIAENALAQKNALVIVNRKDTAREMYNMCKDTPDCHVYNLSTYITSVDRTKIIDKIRADLKNGLKTVVFSTSLIEAGVDLDFNSVFREIAGLDSVIQAGGRCNREGKMALGNVTVFGLGHLNGDMKLKANITEKLFEEFGSISSQAAIQAYYDRIFAVADKMIDSSSITAMMGGVMRVDGIPFRTYAQTFKFIESGTVGIVIRCKENERLINELEYGKLSVKRELQKYCATVSKWELDCMIEKGMVELKNGVYILSNPDYYDRETGLNINKNFDYSV